MRNSIHISSSCSIYIYIYICVCTFKYTHCFSSPVCSSFHWIWFKWSAKPNITFDRRTILNLLNFSGEHLSSSHNFFLDNQCRSCWLYFFRFYVSPAVKKLYLHMFLPTVSIWYSHLDVNVIIRVTSLNYVVWKANFTCCRSCRTTCVGMRWIFPWITLHLSIVMSSRIFM